MKKKLIIQKIKLRLKYCIPNILCSVFPMKDCIVFESHPDYTCNSFELFKYFLKKKANENFKIIWLTERKDNPYKDYKNVETLDINPKTIKGIIKKYYICNRAKILIASNRHVSKYCVSKKQLNMYLSHGSAIKHVSFAGFNCSYINIQSDFFREYTKDIFGVKDNQILCLGFPRNDQLFQKDRVDKKNILKNIDSFDKVIIWLPTFRVHKKNKESNSDFKFPMGIPLAYTQNDLIQLNDFLKENNTLLIIKAHPAQDIDSFLKGDLSNIKNITNDYLCKKGIQTNELLSITDALITDYSGVYFDYLLLDKPVAFTLDDFDQYDSKRGFIFNDPFEIMKGYHVKNLDELFLFIKDVRNNKNKYYEEQHKMKLLTNKYQDSKSSERVYNFVKSLYPGL